ncbi:MAG: CCA tRNA nucleotidyltransferase [Clostridiales bacterium]|nr:CCA tRNA nucleotidyltransferase [Clostridiales bacterium]
MMEQLKAMNSLPGAVRDIVYRINERCNSLGYKAYIVGGAVRDMLLGAGLSDIDVTVVGDALRLAADLEGCYGYRFIAHPSFKTVTLDASLPCRIDIATARRELYPNPAALPEIFPSDLYDDLFRRDFTINAMAVSLEEFCLIDPFGGKNDLQNGTIRVLHNKSFVDDPTRILRGIRFEARYAFRMDKKTEELARASVEGGYPYRLSSERTCTEMENVFRELVYTAILRRMEDLGLWRALFGTGKIPRPVYRRLKRIQKGCPGNVEFPILALLEGVPGGRVGEVFNAYKTLYRKLREYRTREKALRLPVRNKMLKRSMLYKLFDGLEKEMLEYLYWTVYTRQYKNNIIKYMQEIMGFNFHIGGDDLISLGVRPGPRYKSILERARQEIVERGATDRFGQMEILKSVALKGEEDLGN